MAIAAFPSFAHIAELRMTVEYGSYGKRGELSRAARYGAQRRELWRGEMLIASVTPVNAAAFTAFLHGLEGATRPFKIELKQGFAASTYVAPGAITVSAAVPGSDVLALSAVGSSTLPCGALLAIGDIETTQYQVVEVAETVTASGTFSVRVSPRIRYAFTAGTVVTTQNVFGKFRVADETPNTFSRVITSGGGVVKFLEAV